MGHLWFLFALVRCYLLFAILLKLKLEKYAPAISIICLAGTIALQKAYVETFYFRNGWFYGMGFFMAGYCIAAFSRKNPDRKLVYAGIVTGLVLSIVGGFLFPNDQIYIGTIILGIAAFYWAVTKAGDTPKHPATIMLAEIGSKYGTLIYVIHWSIKECLIKVDKMFAFTKLPLYQWFAPILLVILSVVSSVVLYHLIDMISKAVRKKNE